MREPRVLVVGAGLSGLMAAWELTRAGREVVVVDANPRPGGVVCTVEREGYRFETSPIPLQVLHPQARPFSERLGLGGELIVGTDAGRTRHIYLRGRLHAVPRSLRELARSDLFTAIQKARLLMEPLVARRRDRRGVLRQALRARRVDDARGRARLRAVRR
jgi:oxygen-dependent protoporphyrinogen oxidase